MKTSEEIREYKRAWYAANRGKERIRSRDQKRKLRSARKLEELSMLARTVEDLSRGRLNVV